MADPQARPFVALGELQPRSTHPGGCGQRSSIGATYRYYICLWRGKWSAAILARACPAQAGKSARETMSDRSSNELPEAGLLRQVAQRDHGAFAVLYDRMAGLLYSIAIHMLADPREAEEVVQDVFLQIWNKAGTFNLELGNPLAWMLGITRNRCIDRLRSRQRRSKVFDEAVDETEVEMTTAAPAAAADLSGEEQAAVRKAVEALPPDQQQAIAMAFFGGMSHQEIADALREPLGTVKARIRRGMLKLRESLQAYV